MEQHPDPPPPAAPSTAGLMAFDSVPLRARRDGWTVERQRAFIAVLFAKRSVQAAAAAVGMSRESAYRLRCRPGAASFAAAWDAALAARVRDMTSQSLLMHRAFYGTCKPIMHRGEQVGTLVRPDNAALLKLSGRFDRLSRPGRRRGQTEPSESSR